MSAYVIPDGYASTTTTTSSNLSVPEDARSMVGEVPEYVPLKLTKEQQELNLLSYKLLQSKLTPEQQQIQESLSQYLVGLVGIGGVYYACDEYFTPPRKMPGWFSKDKVGKIIKQIYDLSQTMHEKELSSYSSSSCDGPRILSFGDDEDFASLSPSSPQKVIDFFNKPGENHYLFVRTFAIRSLEYEMSQLSAPVTSGSAYWRSFTAIKSGVPIILHPSVIGFLFSNNIDILKTVAGKEAWGKHDLDSNGRYRRKGLLNSPESRLPLPDDRLAKSPIGEKLEEIRLRRLGEIPDMTNKERNGTRKKSEKSPSRYKGKKHFPWNEALGHATNAHLLGLIVNKCPFIGSLENFLTIGLPIFEYDCNLGKLSLLKP